ncbi:acetate--CoA ligase family protein [Gracilimonas mengyeensis]|uniref:Acetyltransferase n=1 Tax=Gracilimonas mengyeensis TaxID=1302730 RepID=A0A521FNL6_9BACT|nr:acetate--CoA ligase [Gracilimonas mengyeensis]SMO97150.1 acetyltransferase [Gracilimonas mengyeensis]
MDSPFFSPKGIAVIGASQDTHKLGYGVIRNLIKYRYKGGIYPVNRKAYEILEQPCFKSVAEVPDPVDLAVIIVPAKAVAGVLAECGERGIQHVIIMTGGFSETGEEGREMEKKLMEVAEEYGIRMIGPNCIGTIDTHTPVNTTFVVGMPEPGDIGFISHSGAMVAAIIDWASGSGIGFSRIVSLGNQIDVNEIEMIEGIAGDPQTKVITAYIEGVSDGQAFLETSRKMALKKPFLMLKGGQGESGARAVASHTGALAGSSEAYGAAFRYCGIQEADTIEEMFEWARAMAWQPLPRGKRVAVLTNAGGPAILAVDALEREGLEIASLSDETKKYLTSRLPKAASVNNPVDVLAGSGPGTYTLALEALLTDENVDAVLVIQAPQDWFLPVSLAEVVGEVAAAHDKTVVTSIMGKASVGDALKILQKRRIPNVAFPERAASLLSAMKNRREWLRKQEDAEIPDFEVDQKEAQEAVKNNDWESLLESYGIRFPEQKTAASEDEAVKMASEIKGKGVMKLVSEEFSHKSDIGGVKLGLKSEADVREAWSEIRKSVEKAGGNMQGVLIQQMVESAQEVIVGLVRDQQFGPMVLFGSGGTDVELYKDVQTAIAPLNRMRAKDLINATKAGEKMKGWRNMSARDEEAVVEALLRLSRIAVDYPEIEELEINPLCVLENGQGAIAVDIRGEKITPKN